MVSKKRIACAIENGTFVVADPALKLRIEQDSKYLSLLRSWALLERHNASLYFGSERVTIEITSGQSSIHFKWADSFGVVVLESISIHKNGLSMSLPCQTSRTSEFGLEAA